MNWFKEHIYAVAGISLPGGFSIYSLIEHTTPILAWIGLLLSCGVGIAALINYREKHLLNQKQLNKD